MHLEEKQAKDPLQERIRYRDEALRAVGEGKDLLALCWRLVLDAAQNFLQQCQVNEIFSSQNIFLNSALASLIQENQEITYRLNNSPSSFSFLTPSWIFSIDELKEAAVSYRMWMAYAQVKRSHFFKQEIFQTTEAIAKYKVIAPNVAFFAQEAARCFQRASKIQQHASAEPLLARELTIYRWGVAAHAAIDVAVTDLRLQTIAASPQTILTHHWSASLQLAQHAFYFRMKAAEATQQGEEATAMHWSLAAYAATSSCDIHKKLLEIFPLENSSLITAWAEALQLAERAMHLRKKAALACEKKRKHWEQTAFWQEHCYDCQIKRIETCSNQHQRMEEQWEKVQGLSKQLLKSLDQAPREGKKSFFGAGCLQEYRKKQIRKKTLALVIQDFTLSFFTMGQPFLDETSHGKLIPEVEHAPFHSWISQTWRRLQQTSVRCDLVEDFHVKGVVILMADAVKFSWGVEKIAPRDLFLVDVVADGRPNPHAHFYIFQNRTYARFFPRSFFMPHWPQPSLMPRNPARGICFEHICFFGAPKNLAPELQSEAWKQRLKEELGLVFTIRPPSQWHDYRDVDGVIAIRHFPSTSQLHKPATKLYNAWLAGVPFIGGSDSAYAADGHPGKDYLVATSPEEVFQHLKRLKEDLPFREMLVQQGHHAGMAFSQEATCSAWKHLVQEVLPERVWRWHQQSRWRRSWFFQTQRLLCYLDTWIKKMEQKRDCSVSFSGLERKST